MLHWIATLLVNQSQNIGWIDWSPVSNNTWHYDQNKNRKQKRVNIHIFRYTILQCYVWLISWNMYIHSLIPLTHKRHMWHLTKIANTCYILILLEDTPSTIYIENQCEATYINLNTTFHIIAMWLRVPWLSYPGIITTWQRKNSSSPTQIVLCTLQWFIQPLVLINKYMSCTFHDPFGMFMTDRGVQKHPRARKSGSS